MEPLNHQMELTNKLMIYQTFHLYIQIYLSRLFEWMNHLKFFKKSYIFCKGGKIVHLLIQYIMFPTLLWSFLFCLNSNILHLFCYLSYSINRFGIQKFANVFFFLLIKVHKYFNPTTFENYLCILEKMGYQLF